MEGEDSMDVDGDKVDTEMASDSEGESSSDDEKREDELNKKKEELQGRVSLSITKINNISNVFQLWGIPTVILKQIVSDRTDYEAYEELIQVLSSLGDLEGLRDVREKFSKEYPLSSREYFQFSLLTLLFAVILNSIWL